MVICQNDYAVYGNTELKRGDMLRQHAHWLTKQTSKLAPVPHPSGRLKKKVERDDERKKEKKGWEPTTSETEKE